MFELFGEVTEGRLDVEAMSSSASCTTESIPSPCSQRHDHQTSSADASCARKQFGQKIKIFLVLIFEKFWANCTLLLPQVSIMVMHPDRAAQASTSNHIGDGDGMTRGSAGRGRGRGGRGASAVSQGFPGSIPTGEFGFLYATVKQELTSHLCG